MKKTGFTNENKGSSSSNPNPNPANNDPLQQEDDPQLELTLAPPSTEDPGQPSLDLKLHLSTPNPPPPPPPPHLPGPAGSKAASELGLQSFRGAQAMPVEGIGYGVVHAAPPLRMGVMLGRKRDREGAYIVGAETAAAGGKMFNCTVCGRGFGSNKALFGHMRSHPERGWRGAHRPPAFNAEEEFADIRAMQRQLEVDAVGGGREEGPDAAAAEEGGEGGEHRNPPLADLNLPPPPEEHE